MAQDRHKFSSALDSIGVDQPAWAKVASIDAAKHHANRVGRPALIRPSCVLSGVMMSAESSEETFECNLSAAADFPPLPPVVILKLILGEQEIDVDAAAHRRELLVHAVGERVKSAAVHFGDATLVLPPLSLPEGNVAPSKDIAPRVALALDISGPFNMQIIRQPV